MVTIRINSMGKIAFDFSTFMSFFRLPCTLNFKFFCALLLTHIKNQWKNSICYNFGVVYTIMRQINDDYYFDDDDSLRSLVFS